MKDIIQISIIFMIIVLCNSCKTTNIPGKDLPGGEFNADYIFKGTVIEQGMSNVAFVDLDQNTYTVKVEKVFKASKGHEHFENDKITVKTTGEIQLNPDKPFIMYADTWLFGESLAVIARKVDYDTDMESKVIELISANEKTQFQDQLHKRIKSSRTVILGKITKIDDFSDNKPGRLSEHLPDWKIAELQIEDLIKGDDIKRFVFSNSRDVHWFKAPKFEVGQEGIFILQPQTEGANMDFLQLTHPMDYQSRDKLEEIKSLLR